MNDNKIQVYVTTNPTSIFMDFLKILEEHNIQIINKQINHTFKLGYYFVFYINSNKKIESKIYITKQKNIQLITTQNLMVLLLKFNEALLKSKLDLLLNG